MLFFITGVSGSGKSYCISSLRELLPNANVHDFDDIGVPDKADTVWRQKTTEKWLQKYLIESANCDIYCICGQVVLGEILACPASRQISKINICLLDVTDIVRISRLKNRNAYNATQDILNWASWLRMHHHDPQWEQHVIKDNAWTGLNFSTWEQHKNWHLFANTTTVDTTELSIIEVAKSISSWINKLMNTS